MWALQEEFDDKQNKIYFQVIPNTSSQVFPRLRIQLEKLKNKKKLFNTICFLQKTGEFEVYVNSTLVHSKLSGDGLVDTRQKFDKISKKVQEELNRLE